MKIAILDGSRVNPFHKLRDMARGVALIAAPDRTFTADVPAPIYNISFPDHFKAYVPRYPLASFTRLAHNRLKALPFHHAAPQPAVAQTANPVSEKSRTKRAALGPRLFVSARRSVQ